MQYMWNKLRTAYPEEVCPKTASCVEDIRANCRTRHNLNIWFTNHK